MKTRMVLPALIALISLSVAPAWAQETRPPQDGGGGGSSEPGSPGVIEPDMRQTLSIGEITLSVNGKAVDAAPAGSDVRAKISVTNAGEQTAKDVALKVEADGETARIIDGTASLGDIAAGDTAIAQITFEPAEKPCNDFVGFVATFTSSLGTEQTKLGVSVLCPGPRLYVSDVKYSGGNGDNIPDPGEKLDVFVTLQNSGRDAATGVRATITIDSADVKVVTGEATWPDIAPADSSASTTPFVITIADDAKRSEGCDGIGPGVRPIGSPEPVQSDEPVSSDAGSSSSSDGTVSSDTPTMIAPVPPGGDGSTTEPVPPPAEGSVPPEKNPVGFEAQMKLTASGDTTDSAFGTMMVCMYAETARGGPAPQSPASPEDAAFKGASSSEGAAGHGGATALASVLVTAAAALVFRFRYAIRRASGARAIR